MTTSNMIELSHPCIKQLITQDAQLAKLIKHIGPITFPKRPSPLKSIIRSIIGQQITVKLAQTIFQSLTETVNDDWSIASLSRTRIITSENAVHYSTIRACASW